MYFLSKLYMNESSGDNVKLLTHLYLWLRLNLRY